MKRDRFAFLAFIGIHAPESSLPLVVISRAVVVNAQSGIELLACKEEIVWRRACGGDQVAESFVIVGVRDRPAGIGEKTHRAVAVIAIEASGQRACQILALSEQFQAVRVRASN